VADGAPADTALQQALTQVFDAAFTIVAVPLEGAQRWVAVPAV
jgi:hypothetical protein